MAEAPNREKPEEEDEDYMGDLSVFLPPETSQLPKLSSKKVSDTRASAAQPSKKKPRAQNWQEQRRLDLERKQREEDELTLANLESAIPQSNVGFKMLKQMGYTPGTALGKKGTAEAGQVEPVGLDIRRSRAGIGREDPHKEKRKKEEQKLTREKEQEEQLMAEFGCRQKSQWRSRRVEVNYYKAKGALAQLRNEEVLEPKEDDEECVQEEEEDEEITEEELEVVLTDLRNEHHYCLFCGFQYESMDALMANCPGLNEDDH